MPRITLFIGVVLAFVGIFFYYYTDMISWTALIPTIFGAVFIVLGLLGAIPNLRKHVMHGAAALSLVGFAVGIWRLIPKDAPAKTTTVVELAILTALCGLLLVLCIKSFIDARRRRKAQV